ncbi:MAG: hypothetical protein PF961_12475 [Planctomycetota bacterium]|jgi:hypothetical protein|nr:hypothetical protein [Planctomycetota bacterium]
MRLIICLAALVVALFTAGCMGDLAARAMGPDPAQQQIDMMKDNAMVPYFVNFHKDPAVGQFAVYKNAMGEEWYGIVGGKDGAWLVEKRSPQPGQDFTIALLMTVDNEGYISTAYAAEYDAEAEEAPVGTEVKVMAKPEPVKVDGTAPAGPKPTWSKDKAGDLACEKMTLDKSEIWYSPKAQFGWMLATETPMDKGGMVKMAYDGSVNIELVKQGTEELEPSMTMPEAK